MGTCVRCLLWDGRAGEWVWQCQYRHTAGCKIHRDLSVGMLSSLMMFILRTTCNGMRSFVLTPIRNDVLGKTNPTSQPWVLGKPLLVPISLGMDAPLFSSKKCNTEPLSYKDVREAIMAMILLRVGVNQQHELLPEQYLDLRTYYFAQCLIPSFCGDLSRTLSSCVTIASKFLLPSVESNAWKWFCGVSHRLIEQYSCFYWLRSFVCMSHWLGDILKVL